MKFNSFEKLWGGAKSVGLKWIAWFVWSTMTLGAFEWNIPQLSRVDVAFEDAQMAFLTLFRSMLIIHVRSMRWLFLNKLGLIWLKYFRKSQWHYTGNKSSGRVHQHSPFRFIWRILTFHHRFVCPIYIHYIRANPPLCCKLGAVYPRLPPPVSLYYLFQNRELPFTRILPSVSLFLYTTKATIFCMFEPKTYTYTRIIFKYSNSKQQWIKKKRTLTHDEENQMYNVLGVTYKTYPSTDERQTRNAGHHNAQSPRHHIFSALL